MTVTITYENDQCRRYEDHFDLNSDLVNKRTYATSSKDPDNQFREAVTDMRKIAGAVHAIAKRMHEDD